VGWLSVLAGRAARAAAGASSGWVSEASSRALVLGALAAVAAFAAFGRVLSPQYLVWVLPLLSLAVAWRMRALAGLCAAACLLTLMEFPSRYLDLVDGEPVAVAIIAARNLALIAAVTVAGASLWRRASAPAEGPISRPLTAAGGAPAR
jgi:hypothetical protein